MPWRGDNVNLIRLDLGLSDQGGLRRMAQALLLRRFLQQLVEPIPVARRFKNGHLGLRQTREVAAQLFLVLVIETTLVQNPAILIQHCHLREPLVLIRADV
jgi:hypothetical protein